MAKPKPQFIIAGKHLNYEWTSMEKAMFIKLVKNGATVRELAKEFNRELLEVYILLDDLMKDRVVEVDHQILR